MKHYERVAGGITRAETFAKLNEVLIEAEELSALMGHLHATEDASGDAHKSRGWRAVSENFHNMREIIRGLMVGSLN